MSFTDRLEYLMRKNGIRNKSELSKQSGIPYTTIDGIYKKGSDNIKLSTLKKLAACLYCSLDFLAECEPTPNTLTAHFDGDSLTPEEQEEVENFVEYVKFKRGAD